MRPAWSKRWPTSPNETRPTPRQRIRAALGGMQLSSGRSLDFCCRDQNSGTPGQTSGAVVPSTWSCTWADATFERRLDGSESLESKKVRQMLFASPEQRERSRSDVFSTRCVEQRLALCGCRGFQRMLEAGVEHRASRCSVQIWSAFEPMRPTLVDRAS